jgi:hypothetical protein
MKTMLLALSAGLAVMLPGPAAWSADVKDLFVIRSSAKPPDLLTDAIKTCAEEKKWLFLGANKVKQGQVT